MLNRTQEPVFKQIENIDFIKAEKYLLKNEIPVFIVNAGEQELVRIEFIFKNKAWELEKPLMPSITNAMLTEGTHSLSSAQIASKIDFYGAFFQTDYNHDRSSLNLFSLNKYLANTLPIIKEMLTGSIFPEKELKILLRNQNQKLKVGLEKNANIARRAFTSALFGDTLYGYANQLKDYDQVKRENLLAYYQKVYQPKNCSIIVSGKIEKSVLALLEDLFGNWEGFADKEDLKVDFKSSQEKLHYIEKPDALQSAIRIGIPFVNRKHPDFIGLQVLNTALGGYFGSRLMNNIREEKGYTYGIGSGIASLEKAGYFFIATEVGVDVTQNTLAEIEKEVNLLKTELIGDGELSLIKNYLMGSLLGSLENAFSHADKFKNLYFFGLDYGYYEKYIHTIKNITPQQLKDLANQYWDYNSFYKIIVGKM
ncbi:insulinase family protein [Pedobacter sp. SD-b]|uniref:Insulinase family protein n=1 Tax=Pedobacter segetis TaxID=2793069 RepID=A0ABS1BI32_9SPHI|nr:pitrilysin family protein [Pedobacter segetis]MBK0382550.1 insulinase family protein [Pedobacter segetis]